MLGYKTPNIDSLAEDGALFTNWYGHGCRAGGFLGTGKQKVAIRLNR
jgi:arylsulfatase A-like enzyme